MNDIATILKVSPVSRSPLGTMWGSVKSSYFTRQDPDIWKKSSFRGRGASDRCIDL